MNRQNAVGNSLSKNVANVELPKKVSGLSSVKLPVISIVSITLTIILLAFISIIVFTFVPWTVAKTVTSYTGSIGVILQDCPMDQCTVNLYNGEKICPALPGGTVQANVQAETCSSPFVCDNPILPYALLSDNSTNINGICEPNTRCRCTKNLQCADNILSTFNTINGLNYIDLSDQRTQFIQNNSSVNGTIQSTVTPIVYTDPATTFCTIPMAWLNRSSPGCSSYPNLVYSNLQECIHTLNSSPCAQGTLAFYPDNPEIFNTYVDNFQINQIENTPMACVRGTKCPNTTDIPYYDKGLGAMRCRPYIKPGP
jgi:hypothetical protein